MDKVKENLGIYIHIPFCKKKCNYCDFNSKAASDDVKENYINALLKDIESKAHLFDDSFIDTIFIGGGTPSILEASQISSILECIRSFYSLKDDAEISVESNPGTVDLCKLKEYKSAGINRISFGLQSTVESELKILGRIHNYTDFLKCFDDARNVGFDNINVDLMSAIPGQNMVSFTEGLKKVRDLSPEHISIYSLIIEEGTPFYEMKLDLPDEDTEREMVHIVPDILGSSYHQYEISNYSKPGFECKHNIKYWKRNDYLGFGVSAAGLIGGNFRYKNIADINTYINHKFSDSFESEKEFHEEHTYLEKDEIVSEYLFLGLRMNEGISLLDFKEKFGFDIFSKYKDAIEKHLNEGLLIVNKEKIALTEKGRDLSNYVFVDFV